MATPTAGKLGSAALAANTDNVIYTVPVTGVVAACVNLNVLNYGAGATSVRIAISTSSTPTTADWIEYDSPIPALSCIERTSLVLSPGEKVIVRTPGGNVNARVHGYED